MGLVFEEHSVGKLSKFFNGINLFNRFHFGERVEVKMGNRNELLQLRVNKKEVDLVNEIQDEMKANSVAETIRQMIKDEALLMKLIKRKSGATFELNPLLIDVLDTGAQQRRWNIVANILRLNTDGAAEIVNKANQNFQVLNQILSGIIFQQNKIGNNLNQLAHAANKAAQVDPSNRDTWNWIIEQLSSMKEEFGQLDVMIDKVQKLTDSIAHKEIGS